MDRMPSLPGQGSKNRDAVLTSRFDALIETLGKLNEHMETQLKYQDRLRMQDRSKQQVAEIMKRRTEPFAGQIAQAEQQTQTSPSIIVLQQGDRMKGLQDKVKEMKPQIEEQLNRSNEQQQRDELQLERQTQAAARTASTPRSRPKRARKAQRQRPEEAPPEEQPTEPQEQVDETQEERPTGAASESASEPRPRSKVKPESKRQQQKEQSQDQQADASEPPETKDQRPQGAQIFGGGNKQRSTDGDKDSTKKDMDVMGWMMATQGMEGAPSMLRNVMAQRFMLERSVDYAQAMHGKTQAKMDAGEGIVGKIGETAAGAKAMGGIGKALGWAKANPEKALAGKLALGTAVFGLHDAAQTMGQYQETGESLGYGAPPGGQTIFGLRNPLGYFGKAAQVGAGYDIEATRLSHLPGGSSMTPEQSKEMMGSLQGQGFGMQPVPAWQAVPMGAAGMAGPIGAAVGMLGGPLGSLVGGLVGDKLVAPLIRGITSLFSHPHGDAANIAAALAPTQHLNPGLKGNTLTAFTPELRYGGVSLNEFRESLKSVGIEARATKQNVDAYTKSLAQTSQELARSTSSSQFGSRSLLQGFTDTTGLPSQTGAALATNPYTQAFAAMHGVMPFAIGDMNPGAFTSSSIQGVQSLIKATEPLAHMPTQYQTLPDGTRVPVIDPKIQRRDLIAKTLNIKPEEAGTLIGEIQSGRVQKRAMMDAAYSTWAPQIQAERGANKDHKLTKQQYRQADAELYQLQHNPAYAGVLKPKDWKAINKSPDMQDRYKELKNRLANASKDDPLNQINKNTGQADGTVKVEFTGPAAKYFQAIGKGVKPAKAASNAGLNSMPSGSNYASIANSTPGDLSGVGTFGTL